MSKPEDQRPNAPRQPSAARPRPRRWPRWVAGLLLVPLVLLTTTWLALRSDAGHRWLLNRLDRVTRSAAGIELDASALQYDLTDGRISLADLELRAVGAEHPFLTIRRLDTSVALGKLLNRQLLIRSLELGQPVFDLGAPLPEPPEANEEASSEPFQITLEQLHATAGQVLGGPLAEPESWLRSWSLDDAEVLGALADGELQLRLVQARLAAQLRDAEPLDARVRATLSGPLAGPWQVADLALDGRGLELTADGSFGTGDGDPQRAELQLEAELGDLLGPVAGDSHLAVKGDFDLRSWSGQARIEAENLPLELAEPWAGRDTLERLGALGSRVDLGADLLAVADRPFTVDAELTWRGQQALRLDATTQLTAERRLSDQGPDWERLRGKAAIRGDDLAVELLEPWIGREPIARLGATGSKVDLEADLSLDPDLPAPVGGQARLSWRRDELKVFTARVRQAAGSAQPQLAFSADLLPAAEGRRHLAGSLRASSWEEIADGQLEATRLELDLPSLERLPQQIAQVLPGFSSAELDALPLIGALRAEVALSGRVLAPRAEVNARWQPATDGSSVEFEATGQPVELRGQVRLAATDLDLELLGLGPAGQTRFVFTATGDRRDFTAALDLSASDLRLAADSPTLDRLELRATSDSRRLELETLDGALGSAEFKASGSFALDQKLEDGRLQLQLVEPAPEIRSAELDFSLDSGTLLFSAPAIRTTVGQGSLDGRLPLAALRQLPQLAELASRLPPTAAEGDVELRFALPGLDSRALLPLLGLDDRPERLAGDLRGDLTFDPARPTAARGQIELSQVEAEVPERSVRFESPLELRLGEQQVVLQELRLRTDEQPFTLTARAGLQPDWNFADPPSELLGEIQFDARGSLDVALLNPFLAGTGAVASGSAEIDARATGPLDRLEARVEVRAPEAEIALARPYATRLEGLSFDLQLSAGVGVLENGSASLNGGPLRFAGSRQGNGDLVLRSEFEEVSYRLDYGLTTELAGKIRLDLPATGRGKLAGEVVVERGVLRRDLDLERELLNVLFPPAELAREVLAEAEDPYGIDLDLLISTRDGVSVKNNLADLYLDWQPLRVRGTLLAPAIEGSIELRPDGLLSVAADGVVARIEPGSRLVFDGQPGSPPLVELQTTSSLEDPSIRRRDSSALFQQVSTRELLGAGNVDRIDTEAATGDQVDGTGLGDQLGGYYAGRLANRLLAGGLSVRPIPVFGETDPGASLTLSRDFSPTVTLAVAIDLREAQGQTYILDLHDLRGLPTLRATVVNTREENLAVTLEQSVELGGGPRQTSGPRIGQLTIEAPPAISKRALRRALDLDEGDVLPAGARFGLEVAAADYLRTAGYPEARVRAVLGDGERRRDVELKVDPGPRVEVVFTGDVPGRKLRRSIAELYRVGVLEEESLDEIRQNTARALRLAGFLDPQIEVTVTAAGAEGGSAAAPSPTADRRLVIDSQGGRRLQLAAPNFTGVEAEEASALAARFASQVERAELAAALPGADDKLRALLRSLGHVEPEILGRQLDDDQLVLRLGSSGRRKITELDLETVDDQPLPDAEITQLREMLELKVGDRATAASAARAARQIEQELRRRGWADARVTPSLEATAGQPLDTTLRLRLDTGRPFQLAEVSFTGLRTTREGWLQRALQLSSEASLDEQVVAEARRRLISLGLFSRVRANVRRSDAGFAALEFDVEERPRFQVSYGARWEEGSNTAAKLEVIDRNLLGRGITLGLEARYETNLRQARLLTRWPRFAGTRVALEIFADASEEREAGLRFENLTSTVQLSLPFGDHWTGRFYGRHRRLVVIDEDPDPFFPLDFDLTSPFLGLQLIYDSRNDRLLPTRGLFASADLSGSDDFLSSELRFVRFFGQVNIFRPVGQIAGRRLIWAQSVRVGLGGGLDGQELDRADRFFAGGAFSVRGYPNRSLGPQEDLLGTLRPLGGEALLVINEELRFPVWGDVGGLLFVDAGNVWADRTDLDNELLTAVGFGIRASTPLGLLRFDLAHPLDRRDGDRSVETYFGFGTTF